MKKINLRKVSDILSDTQLKRVVGGYIRCQQNYGVIYWCNGAIGEWAPTCPFDTCQGSLLCEACLS